MSRAAFPIRSTKAESKVHPIRLVGTGAAAPTVEVGEGIVVTRTGVGVYRITWTDNPCVFLAAPLSLGAATPAAIVGYTLVRNVYIPATTSLDLVLTNTADAAVDLAAAQYIDVVAVFKETSA